MKALKLLAIAAVVTMGLTACLKDKSAEAPVDAAPAVEATDAAAPADAAAEAPAEAPAETPAQ